MNAPAPARLLRSPTDRTNFMAYLGATRVSVALFGCEVTSSAYAIIPMTLLGWFIYLYELHTFDDFTGFAFDPICSLDAFNDTATSVISDCGGGGAGRHYHRHIGSEEHASGC